MKNFFPLLTYKSVVLALLSFISLSLNANAVTGNATNGGAISENQTICPGETPDLFENVTVASGGDTGLGLEYLWMYSSTLTTQPNTWTPAPGVNNGLTYQSGTLGSTTHFVRCARRQGFDFVPESNIVTITVLNTATAIINGTPSGNIYSGSTVNLNATPSPGASYSWDFNGDGSEDCSSQSCNYIYSAPGTYTVKMTVTTSQGCSISTETIITVIAPTGFNYSDPCNCTNTLNFATPTVLFINDFILINSTPGQTWTLSSLNLGQVYDSDGNPMPLSMTIPETAIAGQYFLNLWFDSSVGYNATFTNGSNTVTTGTTNPCSCINPLPVELIDFQADVTTDKKVMLKWSTASETNNNHFQIQHSIDGNRFDNITIVEGAGNTTETTHYSYKVESPVDGRSYYRLKQVDFDGVFEYSPIRQVYLEKEGVSIYPSPAQDWVNIRNLNKIDLDAEIEIVNVDAKIIRRYPFSRDENLKTIDISNLTPGVYYVKVVFSNGDFYTQSFMKD